MAHDLDPKDWDAFARDAHAALDSMIEHLRHVRERPAWQEPTEEARARFHTPMPRKGKPLQHALDDFERYIRPYSTGNVHPLFLGWVHGAGTPVGMVAEMLAAGLNANCGGRDHIAIEVERQITRWMCEAIGFPQNATGLFLTGSSIANFVAVLIARTKKLGQGSRHAGLCVQGERLIAYASREAHQCIPRALDMTGLGSDNLRLIDVDENRAMNVDALRLAIRKDRAAGNEPFMIVGSAGTVNTGAVDPLDALADVAQEENIWFHVDGAIGAVATLSSELKPKFKGMERADTIALDFHKWLNAPYDAGFILARDPASHVAAFAREADYLVRAERGLAAGGVWPNDLGPDLSRGFRALKVWMQFETCGADAMGAMMADRCVIARYLADRLEATGKFALKAPVSLNIVCFGVKDDVEGKISGPLVEALHLSGLAVPSLTRFDGVPSIRAAVVNHRATRADMDRFVEIMLEWLDKVTAH
ncbi:MAG: cytochrome D ubiquinol oxidase subunit I [Hyphomicrobiales bacterium]|nr:cytochrome D ubiquinol oxidase subunit I [Hyphomicrobiales bacterium]